jgi:hypothetical protein
VPVSWVQLTDDIQEDSITAQPIDSIVGTAHVPAQVHPVHWIQPQQRLCVPYQDLSRASGHLMLPGKGHRLCALTHSTCGHHGDSFHRRRVIQLHLRLGYRHWPEEGEAMGLLLQTLAMPSCVQWPCLC